jgi:hypothetical protein
VEESRGEEGRGGEGARMPPKAAPKGAAKEKSKADLAKKRKEGLVRENHLYVSK